MFKRAPRPIRIPRLNRGGSAEMHFKAGRARALANH